MSGAFLIKLLEWGAKAARFVKAERLVWRIKHQAAFTLVRRCHLNVVHRMRRLAHCMQDGDAEQAAHLALQVCTECRKLLGTFLEIKDNRLHCCIKLLELDRLDGHEDKVSTWVRSEPMDDRPAEQGIGNAHLIRTNSVWSAFYGRSDGKTQWRQMNCFACNDLTAHPEFVCDRQDWAQYYRSTLVFPIRYPIDAQATTYDYIGFLAFDSPDTGSFRGLPDIFEYKDRPADYREKLEESTAFHVGALLADVLGTFLRPAFENRPEKEADQNG